MQGSIDIDAIPIGLLSLDQQQKISAANTEAEGIIGLSRLAMTGRSLTELFYFDCPIFDLLERSRHLKGELTGADIELRGPAITNQRRSIAIITREAPLGPLIVFSPPALSETRSDKHLELAAFGRIIGHEVKNPLAGISGAVQLLKRKSRADQDELLDLIANESKRIERLIDRLSAFELFSAPRRKPFNIHTILDQTVRSEQLVFANQVSVGVEYDPSLPLVYGDSDHLQHLFQNLVRNACEAVAIQTRPPGEVMLSTKYAAGMRLTLNSETKAKVICVTISDNGPGIDPETRARIFDMFHTTKPTGSGLGLTVVNQIVRSHNGQLALESRAGRTQFSVYLPISSGEMP